jgi:hypothetical protein
MYIWLFILCSNISTASLFLYLMLECSTTPPTPNPKMVNLTYFRCFRYLYYVISGEVFASCSQQSLVARCMLSLNIFQIKFGNFVMTLGPTQPPIQWVPGLFPRAKAAGSFNWPLACIECWGYESLELYLYSSIRINGTVHIQAQRHLPFRLTQGCNIVLGQRSFFLALLILFPVTHPLHHSLTDV